MRIALLPILFYVALAPAGKPAAALFDDTSRDTLFVLVFTGELGAWDDETHEAWADLDYHLESAMAKLVWRRLDLSRDKDASAWKRWNPGGKFMFLMRYRGKTVLTSTGVLGYSEILEALQAKGLVPPYPLIPDGFVATYRAIDSAAGVQYDYEFLDSNFSLQRFTPDDGLSTWSGSYRMAIDTLKFHFKSTRGGGKEAPEEVRHSCQFTWSRDTLTLLNTCPVAKACDDKSRKAWSAIAGKPNARSDRLVLVRGR